MGKCFSWASTAAWDEPYEDCCHSLSETKRGQEDGFHSFCKENFWFKWNGGGWIHGVFFFFSTISWPLISDSRWSKACQLYMGPWRNFSERRLRGIKSWVLKSFIRPFLVLIISKNLHIAKLSTKSALFCFLIRAVVFLVIKFTLFLEYKTSISPRWLIIHGVLRLTTAIKNLKPRGLHADN